MKQNRTEPYDSLPPLPPAGRLETKAVLRRAIGAARALGELKQAGTQIPNQAVLINTIPLLEAQVSSEIENIVTTSDKLFRLAWKDKPRFHCLLSQQVIREYARRAGDRISGESHQAAIPG